MPSKRILDAVLAAAGAALLSAPAAAQAPAFVKETAAGLPGFNVYRPADLARRRVPAPVVVWANGGCVKADATWTTLFERWAGAGYVVLSINDAEAARAAAAAMAARGAAGAPGAAPAAPPQMDPAMMRRIMGTAGATADAQAKAIDWAEVENRHAGGPYARKLDLTRVVLAGNSCGGISSLTLASRDHRARAVFVLSGSSVGPNQTREQAEPVMAKVTAPVLWVVGGKGQDIARGPAEMDYALQPAGVPGAIVYRASGDHPTVSTTPAIQRDAAEIALNWFKAALYADAAAKQVLSTRGCAGCDTATWSVTAKNFAALRRR